jgi:hypothetical protein
MKSQTKNRMLLVILIACGLSIFAQEASACIFCFTNCVDPGQCFHTRGNGWTDCDVSCQCPTPQQDCIQTGGSPSAGVPVCGPTYLVVSVDSRSGQPNHLPATVGIDVEVLPTDVFIRTVLPGSPAFRTGLRPGDRVVSIQGKEARNLSYREIIRALDGTSKVELTIQRNGSTKTFALSPESLASVSERIRSSWPPADRPLRQTIVTLGGA